MTRAQFIRAVKECAAYLALITVGILIIIGG
jgi:hypothetical protein